MSCEYAEGLHIYALALALLPSFPKIMPTPYMIFRMATANPKWRPHARGLRTALQRSALLLRLSLQPSPTVPKFGRKPPTARQRTSAPASERAGQVVRVDVVVPVSAQLEQQRPELRRLDEAAESVSRHERVALRTRHRK